MNGYLKYRFSNEFDFNLNEGEFVSIVGNNNDLIIHTLLRGNEKCFRNGRAVADQYFGPYGLFGRR